MRFTDRVVLVTGAGSGIGRATALAFAEEGASVVVAARSEDALTETVEQIRGKGGQATAVPTDVSVAAQVANLVDRTVAEYGRLDVAFNNAGVFAGGTVTDADQDEWDRMFQINVTGTRLSMKYEIEYMRGHGGGVIINNSSVLGTHLRRPGVGGYAASKAAVTALTRVAALESIGAGIRINSISPGPSDTQMSRQPGETDADRARRLRTVLPIGRVGELTEIASAVVWLASPGAGFAVGHDLVLDGGASA